MQSMDKIFDEHGNEMSVHTRRTPEHDVEVIINRSCRVCYKFHDTPSLGLICSKCSYIKNWVKMGMR